MNRSGYVIFISRNISRNNYVSHTSGRPYASCEKVNLFDRYRNILLICSYEEVFFPMEMK